MLGPSMLMKNCLLNTTTPIFTDQMHMHEKVDFEFNTFSVFISFSGDALS